MGLRTMEIGSIEKYANKILSYVEGLSTSDNRLYSKSRDRLKAVSETCVRIVHLISQIVEDEILDADAQDEFASVSMSNDAKKLVESLELDIMRLKQFVSAEDVTKTTNIDVSNQKPAFTVQGCSRTSCDGEVDCRLGQT